MKRTLRMLGLVCFMASLALLGWWWTRIASLGGGGGGWSAASFDAVLFSTFAVHHSVLARPWARRVVEQFVPADLVRTLYVYVASLLLAAVCVLWQPVGGVVYRVGGAGALALGLVQILGLGVGISAARRISVRELAGVASPSGNEQLQHGGPYRLVRHPLYLGWVLVVLGASYMTADRLLFAVLSVLYLLIAMPFEERQLEQQHGGEYQRYRRAVRWRLIPYVH